MDNQVQIIYDGFPFFALDMIPDNQKRLNYCVYSYWATYHRNGRWGFLPPLTSSCDSKDVETLISQIEDENSNALPLDTVALNFSNYIFELEE